MALREYTFSKVRCVLNVGVTFVLERRFQSAAVYFDIVLNDPHELNYTADQLLCVKFALVCCNFYADTDPIRNILILKEMTEFQIPGIYYMLSAAYYKLNR